MEESFRHLPGVLDTTVGYTGGHVANPSYQLVCTDTTGHAEAVEVEYDPSEVSYERLLEHFFSIHDPTQLDRQGPDVGRQYRSAVFVHSPDQERAARAMKERLSSEGRFPRPIVTEIEPAGEFWPAEEYHQRYIAKLRGEVPRP